MQNSAWKRAKNTPSNPRPNEKNAKNSNRNSAKKKKNGWKNSKNNGKNWKNANANTNACGDPAIEARLLHEPEVGEAALALDVKGEPLDAPVGDLEEIGSLGMRS
jgi:hypothetical protein